MAKAKIEKVKKPKVGNDADFTDCPTYHFLTGNDRLKKAGTTTWKFVPSHYVGKRAKHVADGGYIIQKAKT